MQNVTLPAYIQDRTSSPALVGVTIAVQLGPLLFLSIPAGALADKVSKQKLMLWMQSISAVLTLGTAYFVARDANLVWIFLVQAGIGSANALNAPAFQASMPLLVHRSDLPGAISLNSAMINGTRVMGPVARRRPRRSRTVRVVDLRDQRGHLPVLHRGARARADARREGRHASCAVGANSASASTSPATGWSSTDS